MNRRLAEASFVTFEHVAIGMVIAIVCAGIVWRFLRIWPKSRVVVDPALAYLRAVPAVALALLAFSILGRGHAAAVFGVAFVSFFPIASALREVRSTSARSVLASGLRQAFPAAFGVAIAAEIIASDSGMGSVLALDAIGHRSMSMMLDLLVIAVLGFAGSVGLEYADSKSTIQAGETKPNQVRGTLSTQHVVLPRPSRVHWACGCVSDLEGGSEIMVWPCANHDGADADVREYLARSRVQSAVT